MDQLDTIIDISHWQGKVDFQAVRAAGITAVFLKATQGDGFADPKWPTYSYWAGQSGLLFAPYHFMTSEPVAAQFDNIMRHANLGDGSPIMLDFEDNPAGGTADADQVADLAEMIEAVTGRKPLIYCGRYQVKMPHRLGGYPLMLAQWRAGEPVCPPGWSQWLFHQYTDKSHVGGIDGDVDRSYFAGTPAELESWWLTGAMPRTVPGLVESIIDAVEDFFEPEPMPEMTVPAVAPEPTIEPEPAPKRRKKAEPSEPSAEELNERELTRILNEEELARVTKDVE